MGSSLLFISIAYYMQKGGGWVQIACKIAYILNGRPHKPVAAVGEREGGVQLLTMVTHTYINSMCRPKKGGPLIKPACV